MVIERNREWGTPGALPDQGVIVRRDAEARHVVEDARRSNEPVPPLGLLGGDLARTLGSAGDEARLRSADAMQFPVDLGAVLVDGRLHWFVAHLVVRKQWWRGRLFAAMNAEFIGRWDVAPRSHPNDGILDTFDVTMSTGDRFKARSRLATGTHLPHPGIKQRRVDAIQLDAGGLDVWLDGENLGPAKTLSVRIEPDALICVV